MTTAQVGCRNDCHYQQHSPTQDYVYSDNHIQPTMMSPGFKPFTVLENLCCLNLSYLLCTEKHIDGTYASMLATAFLGDKGKENENRG